MFCYRHQVGGSKFEHTFDEKYIGVVIDSELVFAEHFYPKKSRKQTASLQKRNFSLLFLDRTLNMVKQHGHNIYASMST